MQILKTGITHQQGYLWGRRTMWSHHLWQGSAHYGHIWPTAWFVNNFYGYTAHSLVYLFWGITTELSSWPTEPKIFTMCLFNEIFWLLTYGAYENTTAQAHSEFLIQEWGAGMTASVCVCVSMQFFQVNVFLEAPQKNSDVQNSQKRNTQC